MADMQRQIDQFRLQALRAQMNPHFTFNALNGIQSLLLKGQAGQAFLYLADFAKLIRNSLEMSQEDWIPLNEEVEFLKTYIKLEKLRFGDKVVVSWEGEENPELADISIPNMLLQPIVENAFKHGLSHLHADGLLSIQIKVEDEFLQFTIADNGVGRKKSTQYTHKLNPNHHSRGLSVVLDRLNWLYRNSLHKASIEIVDLPSSIADPRGSSLSTGTIVHITLPKLP